MIGHRCKSLCLPFVLFALSAPLLAQQEVFQLQPSQSQVRFTLGDVLHTVHGTFHLKSGIIRFNPTTGVASGQIVVDATSGNSGNGMRDRKMNKDVLQSRQFPDIVFAIDHVSGSIPPNGVTTLQVSGNFILHGASHPLTLSVPVDVASGQATADINFDVPYVKWGLKNPSTLFLRVSQNVQIAVHAVGRLQSDSATATLTAR